MADLGKSQRKYQITPEILEELRLAYVGGRSEVSAKLQHLSHRTRIPTYTLKEEANKRGWRCCAQRRNWSPKEDAVLREKIGIVSIDYLARQLGRTHVAIEDRARRLQLSVRIAEGYSMSDLAEVFGVHHTRVKRWADRGLLGRPHRHGLAVIFKDAAIIQFIRQYPREYNLGRVDQDWFKSMIFGHLAEDGDKV
jgi:hypothetical protein